MKKLLSLLAILPLLAACQTTDSGLVGAIRKTSVLASVPTTTATISTPTPDEELRGMGIADIVKPKKKEPSPFEKAQAIQKEKMPKAVEVKPKDPLKQAQGLAMLRQGGNPKGIENSKTIEKMPLIAPVAKKAEGVKMASIEPLKSMPATTGKTLMTLRFKPEAFELTEFEKARLAEFSKKGNLPKTLTLKVGTDSRKKGIELLSLINKRMQEILALMPLSTKVNEIYSPELEENTAQIEIN
jgi:hypothetical protein